MEDQDLNVVCCRALKTFSFHAGPPTYERNNRFQGDGRDGPKVYQYSPDGKYIAVARPNCVEVLDANKSDAPTIATLPAKGVLDVSFSPKGTFMSTWERHLKLEDGSQHKNLTIWNSTTGDLLLGLTQKAYEGWELQFTQDESRALRLVTNEVQIYNTADFAAGVDQKIHVDGVSSFSLSPGIHPHVAVFLGEKKGAPASVRLHALGSLARTSQKNFYKADKIQMKWNSNGTTVLFMTQTDVDKTGQSYYGETNLYLMSAGGTFDCRITLDREGPIHEFEWSPQGKEFLVIYGYMPAKTALLNQRGDIIHDFGTLPRNFASFSPQGRLFCIAGFGNLAGQIDVWDRTTLKKTATIMAPNTSFCQWSPNGRMLLCATLSPRLRVDNGIHVFHHSGELLHVEGIDELYQATWRPNPSPERYSFRASLSPAPAPSLSAVNRAPAKAPTGEAGKYRPPGARGTSTPTRFLREDEGGKPYRPPGQNGIASSGGKKVVPGAKQGVPGTGTKQPDSRNKKPGAKEKSKPQAPAPAPVEVKPAEQDTLSSALSPQDKKRRTVMKKLTAIEGLKIRRENGETLELTQHKKIETETALRKELEELSK